jgi:hypothetical protein
MKLVPAIRYKSEIEKYIQSIMYSEESYYMSGFKHSYTVDIPETDNDGRSFHWAVLNNSGQLVGYISYDIEFYDSVLRNLKILSFVKGSICIGLALQQIIEMINDYNLNKIIIYTIDDNLIRSKYDNLAKNNNGKKYVFKEEYKDNKGKYHDLIRYDIFTKNKKLIFDISDPHKKKK